MLLEKILSRLAQTKIVNAHVPRQAWCWYLVCRSSFCSAAPQKQSTPKMYAYNDYVDNI